MDESPGKTRSQLDSERTIGAFINAQGEEVEITEHMIQQACAALAEQLPNHLAVESVNN